MANEYIELDRAFMNHVGCCGDMYQERDSFLNEEIKNNFQKVLDKVKPVKFFRPCSDEEVKKYDLDMHRDICNALDYEKCYRVLLDQVKQKSTEEKIDFLLPYVPYLRGILQADSAVLDNEDVFETYRKNGTVAFLLVYRYEHNISILSDLRMEFSGEAVDDYNVLLSKKLSNEMIMKELDFQKNHPEEFQKQIESRRKNFDEDMERLIQLAEANGFAIDMKE